MKRWTAKYIHPVPEQGYECTLHEMYMESNRVKMRKLEAKVRELMKERQDYKSWYYVPVSTQGADAMKQLEKDRGIETLGYKSASK